MTDTVFFLTPPVGLEPHTDFDIDHVADSGSLFALQATTDPSVRLFAVDPADVVPDYSPVISGAQADLLGLNSPDDAVLFVIARAGEDGVGVNLLAPIVVNRHTGAAAQVILDDSGYSVRALLS